MASILNRMTMILRANINDLLAHAEDPEKMLNQILADMQDAVLQGRAAVAEQVAAEKLAQADLDDARAKLADWTGKAQLAVSKEMDDLAREALHRQAQYEEQVKQYQKMVDQQHTTNLALKAKLADLVRELEDLRINKESLIARSHMAAAQNKIQKVAVQLDTKDYSSTFGNFERRIQEQEARVAAVAEMQGDSVERRFDKLAADEGIEQKLAELKAKMAPKPA